MTDGGIARSAHKDRSGRGRIPAEVAGWVETGRIARHVLRVERDGVRGVLKRPRLGQNEHFNARSIARFKHEVAGLIDISDEDGVLRVLDSDADASPPWFVTPQATLLAEHLGETPNLRSVVEAIADLADTLAVLQEAGIAHRDIKPDNLFWFGNRAVFGDFGIATWPNRDANLTAFGEKVGSAHFLAPEVRAIGDSVDYFAADVWSLIKAMHVLANPADGPYPPGGTHYHGVAEFSLQASGDRAAAELEWLLETCTDPDPGRRLPAEGLAYELRVWLEKHPAGTVQRYSPPSGFRTWGNSAVQAEWRRFQQIMAIVDLQIMRAAIAIGEPVEDDGCVMPSVNDDYPYTDAFDHFVSRGSVTAADGRRAAFAALMWMSSGTEFRVEIQRDGGGDDVVALDVMRADVVQPERPSGQKMLDDLVDWARERLSVQTDEG